MRFLFSLIVVLLIGCGSSPEPRVDFSPADDGAAAAADPTAAAGPEGR